MKSCNREKKAFDEKIAHGFWKNKQSILSLFQPREYNKTLLGSRASTYNEMLSQNKSTLTSGVGKPVGLGFGSMVGSDVGSEVSERVK